MRIANPSQVTNWKFYLTDPKGDEVFIPPSGHANTLQALTNQVLSYIGTYDTLTGGEYSKEQRRLAQEYGVGFEVYIKKLIEHQMCTRRSTLKCYNEGVGDQIHNALSKVDGFVERAPEGMQRVIKQVFAAITPSKSRTLGGCGACGGTRTMKPNVDNLGRAGKLNRLFRR